MSGHLLMLLWKDLHLHRFLTDATGPFLLPTSGYRFAGKQLLAVAWGGGCTPVSVSLKPQSLHACCWACGHWSEPSDLNCTMHILPFGFRKHRKVEQLSGVHVQHNHFYKHSSAGLEIPPCSGLETPPCSCSSTKIHSDNQLMNVSFFLPLSVCCPRSQVKMENRAKERIKLPFGSFAFPFFF